MLAWMASIQVRQDASGDVHVNLDSSAPCWNDGIERGLIELTDPLRPYFLRRSRRTQRSDKGEGVESRKCFFLRVLRGDAFSFGCASVVQTLLHYARKNPNNKAVAIIRLFVGKDKKISR
jgi:hypothetical protein